MAVLVSHYVFEPCAILINCVCIQLLRKKESKEKEIH